MTGRPPEGFSDAPIAFAVEERADGTYVALPDVVERPRRVSDVLVETLVAWGVDTVFGMVGHSNLGFADALRKAEGRGEIRYIGIRHEGAAAFAASAYGKLTGRPAACFAIAGPGSTNLLTGLYDARLDGAPVLAISGQVPSKVLGRGAFQDVDLSAVFRDVALSTVTVHAGSDHAELAATAVKHALDGRGVAHLVLPDEVQDLPSDAPAGAPLGRRADGRGAVPGDVGRRDRPAAVCPPAGDHRRPGRPGRDRGDDRARRTARRAVLTTFRAKGLVPDTHPLGAGVLGRSGTPVASWLMNESDVLLVVGASFANHTGIAPYKPIVQIDDTPSAIGRFQGVGVGVLGDAAVSVRAMLDGLGGSTAPTSDPTSPPARRSGAGRRPAAPPTTAAMGSPAPQSSPPFRALPGGRNDRRRRRQPRLLVRPLLRERRPVGRHVRIPWLDRVRLPSGDRRLGRRPVPARRRRDRRRRVRSVPRRADHGGQVPHPDQARPARQPGARQDLQGTARRAVPGVADSLVNPDFAEYAGLCGAAGIPVHDADELDTAMKPLFAADGPALLHVHTDGELV